MKCTKGEFPEKGWDIGGCIERKSKKCMQLAQVIFVMENRSGQFGIPETVYEEILRTDRRKCAQKDQGLSLSRQSTGRKDQAALFLHVSERVGLCTTSTTLPIIRELHSGNRDLLRIVDTPPL